MRIILLTAKDIRLQPIDSGPACRFVRRHHYSGKVAANSQLHLGVFLSGRLHGVMQFGPPLQRSSALCFVEGTKWGGVLELNRLAFDADLPRNSESRALGVAARIIKRQYPHVEWILSYADGTQCGDGTIYRAAGFLLTAIKKNKTIGKLPDGTIIADISLRKGKLSRRYYESDELRKSFKPLPGFQLRYIKPLRRGVFSRLNVPVLPYSAILEAGASMYLGKAREVGDGGSQPSGGGATPTRALQSS